MCDIRNHLLTFDLDLSTIHIHQLTTMRSDWHMRCEWRWCNRSHSTWINEGCPQFLKITRKTRSYWVWEWCTNVLLYDSWIKVAWIREIVDVESWTTESIYMIRVWQDSCNWSALCWRLSDSYIAVAELEVVGLEILWVDLVVASEWADLEGIDEYCKLPLSTLNQNLLWVAEEILESSILLVLCSPSIDLKYVLISHKLSRLIFPCRSLILTPLALTPIGILLILTPWPSRPLTFAFWFWSCLFLLLYPSDSEGLRTLLILFLSDLSIFDLCLCPSWRNWSWSSLTHRTDRWAWSLPELHCWSSWSEVHELEAMLWND